MWRRRALTGEYPSVLQLRFFGYAAGLVLLHLLNKILPEPVRMLFPSYMTRVTQTHNQTYDKLVSSQDLIT